MNSYLSIPNVTMVLTLAATFVVLFTTVLKILRRGSSGEGKTAVILALCVCIIVLSQFIIVPGELYGTPEVNRKTIVPVSHLLLSYFALSVAGAIVLSEVLVLAGGMPPSKKPPAGDLNTNAKESERSLPKSKLPGRPKKAESKSPPTTQKPAGKGKSKANVSPASEGITKT
jgi:hypothetical protein